MSEDLDSVVAHARYEWDCQACGYDNREDHDPSGETVECEDCGAEFYVRLSL